MIDISKLSLGRLFSKARELFTPQKALNAVAKTNPMFSSLYRGAQGALNVVNAPRPDVTRFTPQYNQFKAALNQPAPQWMQKPVQAMQSFNQSALGAPGRIVMGQGNSVPARLLKGYGDTVAKTAMDAGNAYGQNFDMVKRGVPLSGRVKPLALGGWSVLKGVSQMTPKGLLASSIPGAIGAGIAKVQGNDPAYGAGQGVAELQGWRPLLNITNPVISKVSNKLAPKIMGESTGAAKFLLSQATQRGVHGAGNVIEDEILDRLNQLPRSNYDRLFSLAIGAGMAGNQEVISKLLKNVDVQAIAKQLKLPVKQVAKQLVALNDSTRARRITFEDPTTKVKQAMTMNIDEAGAWASYLDGQGIKYKMEFMPGGVGAIGSNPKPPTDQYKTAQDIAQDALNYSNKKDSFIKQKFPEVEIIRNKQGQLEKQIEDITTAFRKNWQDLADGKISREKYDFNNNDLLIKKSQLINEKAKLDLKASTTQKNISYPEYSPFQSQPSTPKPPDPTEALKAEARKYKSAEEFVKAQPKVFHGTDADFKNFETKFLGSNTGKTKTNLAGFSFTNDKKVAETFGKNIVEANINLKNPLIIDAKGVSYSEPFGNFTKFKFYLDDLLENVDKKKYDGLIIKNYSDAGLHSNQTYPSTHIIPFSEKSILTKSQLTDLWNQSQVKPPTDPTEALKVEARKYKSAEEFVQRMEKGRATWGTPTVRINPIQNAIDHTPYVGKPGKRVEIFRVTPGNIEAGDLVFTSKKEAEKYMARQGDITPGSIKSMVVDSSEVSPAFDMNTQINNRYIGTYQHKKIKPGFSSVESVYVPKEVQGKSLTDLWNQSQVKPNPKPPTSNPKGIRISQQTNGLQTNKTKLQTQLKSEIATPTISSSAVSSKVSLPQKGELNINKLAVDDTGKQALEDINKNIKSSVISNKSVVDRARTANGRSKPMSDEQMKDIIAQQLKNRQVVVDLSAKYSNAKANGASEAELGKIMLELANQSRTAQQGGTFAGRLLQAQNIVADKSATPMQKILALLDNAGVKEEKYLKDAVKVNWDDPKQVVQFYRKYVPPQLGEVLTEIRYTNMLSSPLTHIVNTASNALQTGIITPIEKTITGSLDSVKSLLTGSERKYYARAGIDYSGGYVRTLPKAFKKAWNVLTQQEISYKPDMEYVPTGVGGPLGAYTTPLRALEAMDQFFKTLVEGGVTQELKNSPLKLSVTKIAKQADQEATYRLFRQSFDPRGELGQGKVLQLFDKWNAAILNLRRLPGGKWVLPFLQTPTNILKQGVEYSPLGVSTMVGAEKPIEQLSKAIIGTGVFLGAYQLAKSGLTSWEAPSSEKERELYYAAGLQPYSIKIGDKWVSYSKLGPLSYPIAMAAALANAEQTKPDQSRITQIGDSIGGILGFFGDQSYVRNIGDLIDSIQGGVNISKNAMSSQAANLAGQLVPYKSFITWLGRITDPTYRKASGFGERMIKDIPGIGSNLEPYTDPTGKPSMRDLPMLNAFSPFKVTQEKAKEAETYRGYKDVKIYSGIKKRAGDKIGAGDYSSTGREQDLTVIKAKLDNAPELLTPQEIATYYESKVTKPSNSSYEQAIYEKDIWSQISNINSRDTLTQQQKDDASIALLSKIGAKPEDYQYHEIAKQVNDLKTMYVEEELTKMMASGASKEDIYSWLVDQRREVNGKMVLAPGVIDDLVDKNIISYYEGKQLKAITVDSKTKKVSTKSSGTKAKKIKVPALKKIAPPKIPKVKIVAAKVFKAPKVKKIKIRKINTKIQTPKLKA